MEVPTKEEWKILELYRQNILEGYTIPEIMRKLGKNSYSWAFNSVKKLKGAGILKSKRTGHSDSYYLDLNSSVSTSHLSFIEESMAQSAKLPQRNINDLLREIPLAYFSFIITGSYANEQATKKSDLDVVIIIENGLDTKKILNVIRNKGSLMVPEVHPYVFTRDEFLDMLLSKEENYGKMIFRNKMVIFGAQNYYLILREAIENGFHG
jgi:predicted nucleotidyltransferase